MRTATHRLISQFLNKNCCWPKREQQVEFIGENNSPYALIHNIDQCHNATNS